MKLDRMLAIITYLLNHERVKAQDLAERFEVSVRTILRDIEAINLAGIPVVTYQGIHGGIGLAGGYRLDRSIFTADEMAAIVSSLKGIAATVPDSSHQILLEKMKSVLTAAQVETLNVKTNQLIIDLTPWGSQGVLKEKLGLLRKAVAARREVDFSYADSAGRRTSRAVEPYSLVLKGQNWYLYAWCKLRGEFRLFKLARLHELAISDRGFAPREVDIGQLQLDGQWQEPGHLIELEMVFIPELEAVVSEWFGGDMLRDDTGKIMVRVVLPESYKLYGFLLSFGTGVEVIRPPHLRGILAEIAAGIVKKYTAQT